MIFVKEFFEKVDLKKNSRRQINHEKLPSMQRVKGIYLDICAVKKIL